MSYTPYEPIDPREAFTVMARAGDQEAESVAASQAALLLAIRAGVLGQTATTEILPEFPLPELTALKRDRHVKVAEACQYLGVTEQELQQEDQPAIEREMKKAAQDVYEKPSTKAAAALFEAAMASPHPLVAVAGAAGARETTRLRPKIRETLETASNSDDRLVARLALAAMSKIAPMSSIVDKQVIKQPTSRKRNRESSTAVIAHGTFASDIDWYRPGGNFYEALKANRPDLDVHDQSYQWSGGYTDKARREGAQALMKWIADQGLNVPDFFAHSHGGTVAHLATKLGVQLDRLVLMGWPVRKRWFPDFSKVNRIIDVRVQLDLVVLLDFGRHRFRSNQFPIEEHRHGWFDHSSTSTLR